MSVDGGLVPVSSMRVLGTRKPELSVATRSAREEQRRDGIATIGDFIRGGAYTRIIWGDRWKSMHMGETEGINGPKTAEGAGENQKEFERKR